MARRVCGNDAVPGRPAGVDSDRQLSLLQDTQVHIGLRYPSQCQLQSAVPAVTYIVCSKTYHLPHPRSPLSTPAHSLPMYTFSSSSSSAARPSFAIPSLSLFLVPLFPQRQAFSVPVPVPTPPTNKRLFDLCIKLPAPLALPPSFFRSRSCSAHTGRPSLLPSPFLSPFSPFIPTMCHSPRHGVLRSALTPGASIFT